MLHLRVVPRILHAGCRELRRANSAFPIAFTATYLGTVVLACFLVVPTNSIPLQLLLLLHLVFSLFLFKQFAKACELVDRIVRQVRDDRLRLKGSQADLPLKQLGRLGSALDALLDSLISTKKDLENSHLQTVKAIALAVEAKDSYTQGHCLRVRYLTRRILGHLDMDAKTREDAEIAALLHDVGKIGIPERLLLKRGKLTAEEYSHLMMHVENGVEILQPLSALREVSLYVRHHHERYDGTGYPDGLKGEEIPLPSRVIAVADTVDAMRSSRPYRPALSMETIIAELHRARGTQLDPRLVDIAISVLMPAVRRRREREESFRTGRKSVERHREAELVGQD